MATNFTHPFDPTLWRSTIWAITAVFESGRPEGNPAAYQTYDSGIVSYGKHQATLASGNLWRILDAYFQRSQTPTAMALRNEYAGRVQGGDASLRDDARLKELLLLAANEPAMSDAQDSVFDSNFYQPAIQRAQELNIRTPLGLACIYDNRIQGGFKFVLEHLVTKLGGEGIVGKVGNAGVIEEDVWIETLLNEREAYLNRLANKAEAEGRAADAKALRISTFRVTEIRTQAQARNYGLVGPFKVRGQTINGITYPAVPATQPATPAQPAPTQAGNHLKILSYSSPANLNPLAAGTPFTATWKVKNTGSTTWGAGYLLKHQAAAHNTSMADKLGYQLSEVSNTASVAPGAEATFIVKLSAPTEPGSLSRDELRLQDPQGKPFGESLLVTVAIKK